MLNSKHSLRLVRSLAIIASFMIGQVIQADDLKTINSVLKQHCYQCHGNEEAESDLNLASMSTQSSFLDKPKIIENIIGAISDREMPPEGEKQIGESDREKVLVCLKNLLNRSLSNQPFLSTPIRRMNRFQYNNAVVDLFGLDRDIFQMNERLLRRRSDYFRPDSKKMPDVVRVSSRPLSKDIDNQRPEGFRGVAPFPQDKRAEHGFDNRGDHLTMSPLLMESFLKLSQSISESPDLNPRECRTWNTFFADP